jgi:hypothetical protein
MMSEGGDESHGYGTADPDNRQPMPDQGIRGEQGAPLGEPSPHLQHVEELAGKPITVVETSGVAFAEVTKQDSTEVAEEKAESGAGLTGG